jgi:TonB family protein
MPKSHTLLALTLVAVSLCARAAVAQTTMEWIVLSPASEGFTARVPRQPVSTPQRVQARGLDASGLRYAAADEDGTTFVVWSMKGSHAGGPLGGGDRATKFRDGVAPFLDEVAELAWELLVTPELERIKREVSVWKRRGAAERVEMTYRRGLEVGGLPAREYSVTLEKLRGHVYLCSEGAQVYVVAALGADARDERLRQFVDSFALKSAAPAAPAAESTPSTGTGIGPGAGTVPGGKFGGGGGGNVIDYSRPFRQSEVTKRAAITSKPEPGFTEQARRFNVTGVVRLRAILHSSGEMRNITVVMGLPHGLTEKSVEAARRIRFEPAQKDGRAVSQYVVLEYNYNIY